MQIDTKELLDKIMQSLDDISYLKSDDIPNIDLYMDQVTTLLDKNLKKNRSHASDNHRSEDKVMTKTMINNYAKNNLLPAPVKKKYSREHVLMLIFIYYYKGILSISDIQKLFNPITEKYFKTNGDFDLKDIYDEVFTMGFEQIDMLKEQVRGEYEKAMATFQGAPEEDKDFLRIFSFICLLSFDVYVKKTMIEQIIEGLDSQMNKEDK